MPYIKQEHRECLKDGITKLSHEIGYLYHFKRQTRDGLLNYTITKLIKELYPDAKYHDWNEVIGMLECCKLEVYRKMIGPYEDLKEIENGKV